jgi:alkanesulfonate monooxygenase SsuD/methylene tetrahydromethanopterin reductase-like flavin-dependent oxidoreductase (luciferase family)/iron-sulfur cluster repair protein YtfE (RIC family)
VAPNVANLPLRPPAMLARSVASLDLLSHGRVELGLGAGGFPDAIAALGGPRRKPAEAVAALDEALDVIRAVWDVSVRSVRHEGVHYRVVGAHPGPAPAHPVEIWLGAYKPRMLRLTGAKADGWLPTMSYAGPDGLPTQNAIIDEAARAAGRAPSDVRRLYNVDAPVSAEQLAEIALTHGMSTFFLAGDDADAIRRFGTEVAPAVRELVAAERAGVAARVPAERPAGEPFSVRPTPDDGVRRSAEQSWDETTRPHAPQPDPQRRFTPEQQATSQHLIDVHDMFRRKLAQLRDLFEQVEAGATEVGEARSLINTMALRQNNWALGAQCESYCRVLTTHHTAEDTLLFPKMRYNDPELRPVITRLEEEHEVIAGILDRIDRALVATVSAPDGLARLRAALDLLTDALLSHLSYEERELVEPLARFGF